MPSRPSFLRTNSRKSPYLGLRSVPGEPCLHAVSGLFSTWRPHIPYLPCLLNGLASRFLLLLDGLRLLDDLGLLHDFGLLRRVELRAAGRQWHVVGQRIRQRGGIAGLVLLSLDR